MSRSSVVATAALAVAALGAAAQVAYGLHAGAVRLHHGPDQGFVALDVSFARRIPEGARFVATSYEARNDAHYALYPRRPAHLPFRGLSESAARARLAAARVRYVLVTEPVVPAYLAGRAGWYRVLASHRHPTVRLLEVLR